MSDLTSNNRQNVGGGGSDYQNPDLTGGEERKSKFMRLMGGNKNKTHGEDQKPVAPPSSHGYGSSRNEYQNPPQYVAPQYQAPHPTHGNQHYPAPPPNFNAPPPPSISSIQYGAPPPPPPSSEYGAPPQGPPPNEYGAPPYHASREAPQHLAQQQSYGGPPYPGSQQSYGASKPHESHQDYGAPKSHMPREYGAPPPRYGDRAPSSRHDDGAPPSRYGDGAPPSRYDDGAPRSRYGDGAPPSRYDERQQHPRDRSHHRDRSPNRHHSSHRDRSPHRDRDHSPRREEDEGQEEGEICEGPEEKKKEPVEVIQVETANKWEESDLGDDERKNKFLRLMGATRHKDKDVQGANKHARTKEEIERAEAELESQFHQGVDKRFGHKPRKSGLGFSREDPPAWGPASESPWAAHQTPIEEAATEGAAQEAAAPAAPPPEEQPKKGVYGMFVKSSDS